MPVLVSTPTLCPSATDPSEILPLAQSTPHLSPVATTNTHSNLPPKHSLDNISIANNNNLPSPPNSEDSVDIPISFASDFESPKPRVVKTAKAATLTKQKKSSREANAPRRKGSSAAALAAATSAAAISTTPAASSVFAMSHPSHNRRFFQFDCPPPSQELRTALESRVRWSLHESRLTTKEFSDEETTKQENSDSENLKPTQNHKSRQPSPSGPTLEVPPDKEDLQPLSSASEPVGSSTSSGEGIAKKESGKVECREDSDDWLAENEEFLAERLKVLEEEKRKIFAMISSQQEKESQKRRNLKSELTEYEAFHLKRPRISGKPSAFEPAERSLSNTSTSSPIPGHLPPPKLLPSSVNKQPHYHIQVHADHHHHHANSQSSSLKRPLSPQPLPLYSEGRKQMRYGGDSVPSGGRPPDLMSDHRWRYQKSSQQGASVFSAKQNLPPPSAVGGPISTSPHFERKLVDPSPKPRSWRDDL